MQLNIQAASHRAGHGMLIFAHRGITVQQRFAHTYGSGGPFLERICSVCEGEQEKILKRSTEEG